MPRWAVYLFWIWFFVSLVILIGRRVNARRPRGATGALLEPSGPVADASSSGTSAATVAPSEKVWPAPPPPDPDDDTFRLDPTEVGDTAGADAAASPGASAPPGAWPPPDTPPVAARPTLPELLSGITLPHELVPLTQGDVKVDLSSHVVVATEKAGAEQVTSSMIHELEKLGYEAERESMLKVRAHGPRGAVRVEVHADGAAVLDGPVRRFPTAREGMVVVEIWAD